MAPPKTKLDISPAEVVLDLTSSSAPSATLTLANNSDDENMLFKVRTTNPNRYLVKPNQELIVMGGSSTITIQMQARECTEILENPNWDDTEAKKDKFMISTIVVDDATIKQLKTSREAGTKELQQAFSSIWSSHGKDDTANRRIGVNFILPKGATGTTAPAANPASSSSNAAPTPSAASSNGVQATPVKSAAKPVERSAPASSTALAAAASQQPTPASMTSLTASQGQPPSKKVDEGSTSINGAEAEGEISYSMLSKQYKEILATLVQVTEERDRIQQRFKEISKEVVQIKEDARSTTKGRSSGDAESLAMTKSGYQIWHLVLVAMVSFLVAKLMELSRNEFVGKAA